MSITTHEKERAGMCGKRGRRWSRNEREKVKREEDLEEEEVESVAVLPGDIIRSKKANHWT